MPAKRTGTIVEKSGGRLYVVISRPDADGKRRREYHRVEGDTREAADKLRIALLHSENEGAYITPTALTVGDYLDRWLEIHASRVRPTTLNGYRNSVRNYLKPAIGNIKLQALAEDDIITMFESMLDRGLSRRTVQQAYAVLGRALKDARRRKLFNSDPMPPMPRNREDVKDDGSAVLRAWDFAQVQTFLSGTEGTRLHIAWVLLAMTGMRREEATGLLWEDVDLDNGIIKVRWTRTEAGAAVIEGRPKTKTSKRDIEIDDDTIAALRRWQEQIELEKSVNAEVYGKTVPAECSGHGSSHVLVDEIGAPIHPNKLSRDFRKISDNLGLPRRRLHDLRHSHATLWLKMGKTPLEVSRRLGHSTVAFTLDVYADVLPDHQRSSANEFAAMLKAATK